MEKTDIIKEKLESSGKQEKKPTKSKKSKKSEPLTEEQLEKLPKLPKDWKWVSHSEIATINPPKPDGNELLEVSFLPMPAVEEETGKYSISETRKLGEVRKGYTGFIEGDVIFAKITPCMENGKVAYLQKLANGIGFGSTEFHVSRPTSSVFGKYLFHYLVQQTFRKEAKRSMTGSAGQLRVPSSYFAEQPFPLAPLPEQRAIVSKIEQLFSELDNGIANLKLAQEQLKVYRQAVLKKAFEGELTKKWRKENKYGGIEQLLLKVNKERLEYFQNKGKKIKQVTPISEEEVSELVPLPKNWKRVRLNDLSFLITDGKHGDCKNRENSGYFFISAKDIFDGKINYTDARQIQKEDFEEVHKRTYLQPDDVLVTNAGTIGRIAIATANDKTSKTTFQKSVAIIKKPNSLIDSKYLAYHLENDVESIKLVSKGTAQKNLLLGTMSELIIAVCPVEEQQAIVQEIETRLSVCDKIEQDIETNLEKAEALRQSILKKAFEGKLLNERELAEVRRAEDWEPAEVLLERIKVEKAGNGKK